MSTYMFGGEVCVSDAEHEGLMNELAEEEAEDIAKMQIDLIQAKSDVFNFLKQGGSPKEALIFAVSKGIFEESQLIIFGNELNIFEKDGNGIFLIDKLIDVSSKHLAKLSAYEPDYRTGFKAIYDKMTLNCKLLTGNLIYLKMFDEIVHEALSLPVPLKTLIVLYALDKDQYVEPQLKTSSSCIML